MAYEVHSQHGKMFESADLEEARRLMQRYASGPLDVHALSHHAWVIDTTTGEKVRELDRRNENALTALAERDHRQYITPEDVTDALKRGIDKDKVRLDVLEVLGAQTEFGAEDAGLCAFIAFKGEVDDG
jgi:hypothetical protein